MVHTWSILERVENDDEARVSTKNRGTIRKIVILCLSASFDTLSSLRVVKVLSICVDRGKEPFLCEV